MSPTSIATALAMARAGADGPTASQMDTVLRANGWGDLGGGMGSLEQILNGHNATWEDGEGTRHALSLNMVNRAFGQDGWTIKPSFLDRIGSAFGAGLALVDYVADPDAARDTHQRLGRAPDARPHQEAARRRPDVTAATRLALVNAIYLKANWAARVRSGPDRQPPVHDVDRYVHQGPDDAHGGRAGHRARAGPGLDRPRSSSTPGRTVRRSR